MLYLCMMKLSEFYKRFPDELACTQILKSIKDEIGVICKKCGNDKHYWKKDKKSFECKQCNFRTSLKKDTVMAHSNLSLRYWMATIAYLNLIEKEITALELQKEFGHKRYEPIWLMLKKIKNMSETDYFIYHKISDYIKLDESIIK